jgi:hypothetical protein
MVEEREKTACWVEFWSKRRKEQREREQRGNKKGS